MKKKGGLGLSIVGDNIAKLRKEMGLTQEELAIKLGYKSKSTINKIELGINDISQSKIIRFAKVLNTTPAYLMGWDDTPALPTMPANIVPVKRRTVPLLGEIAAGQPIYAEEEHDLCVAVDDDIRCDFALRVRGDSMIDAGIYDGDVVLVRRQDDVDNGQIAVVLIDDEATLKYLYHQPDGVQLVPANRRYSPWSYTGAAASQVRILGLAVAQYHSLV